MTEPICVCGHPETWHTALSKWCVGGVSGTPDTERVDCDCEFFRESLPWPDAVGAWWCSELPDWSRIFDGEQLFVDGRWFSRQDFENVYLPARFARVLEQNPFTETK